MRFLEIHPRLVANTTSEFPIAVNLEHVSALTKVDENTTAVVDIRGGSITLLVPYDDVLSYFGNVAVLEPY